jgi:DNA polymerase-3 subunit alpha
MDRVLTGKLPDIDSDLPSRELLVGKDGKSGYLYTKYGNKCAQISTRNTVRLKTAIKDANRFMNGGTVEEEIEMFAKGLPNPQQGVSDHDTIFGFENKEDGSHVSGLIETSEDLKDYVKQRPKEWAIVERALGITRSFGVHPAAFILCDEPISNIIPLKEGNIAQYEMKEVEAAGLIKYDFLVVSQLLDIQECLKLINKRNKEDKVIGYFTHQGKQEFIWDLPGSEEVFKNVWGGATETLFQINTKSMTPFVKEILPQSIDDLGVIVALVRPGPLDFIDEKTGRSMAEEYCMRRKGESAIDIPILGELISDTYGVMVYQESLTKVARELAGFPGDEAEKLRENMGKKKMSELMKMKPKFIEGATGKVTAETAEEIWERMVTFGRYGFNKSHSIGYAHITYACMFLKYFYPMEWWAAVLSNADEKEITTSFWPYVKDLVLPPDINLSGDMMAVDYDNQKLRAKLGVIKGMGAATIDPVVAGRPYADIQDYANKEVAGDSISHKLIHIGVLDSLFPPKLSLPEKLKLYEEAVQKKTYSDKVAKAKAEGKKVRALAPKPAKIPEGYLNLHPLKEAAMKKSVLPTLPINIHDLGKNYSKVVDKAAKTPVAVDHRGYRSPLIGGDYLQRLDQMDGHDLDKDIYVAVTVFIIGAKEFAFANGSKRALKLNIDADGYISEKVLWPNYDSGVLEYPDELKKDTIATIFLKKRVGKKDMSIMSVVVES